MASASVTTAQVIDRRIEPQPNPVYAATVGPDQNQYYQIPASGLSNDQINFNNLTTLGKDRAYLDSFEVETTVEVTFTTSNATGMYGVALQPPHGTFMPVAFPLNSVCELARVNINGGSFFNNPMACIRAKERYWDDKKLQESFGNHTPCCKPYVQDEVMLGAGTDFSENYIDSFRTRLFHHNTPNSTSATGPIGTDNFTILPNYPVETAGTPDQEETRKITITWREPIFCSPFSSRYDETYGRPLYNITSIDIALHLVDLRNMFIHAAIPNIKTWSVNIVKCDLCYQVLTVSAPINHSMTVVPYRRFVPYITNLPGDSKVKQDLQEDIEVTSGVYTLNEVPTAIWVFLAPTLSEYQRWTPSGNQNDYGVINSSYLFSGTSTQTSNKLFGFLKHINISCGNTTQILDTANQLELYRIAKANGCLDTFEDWGNANPYIRLPAAKTDGASPVEHLLTFDVPASYRSATPPGVGSVLRLIPGTDFTLPEQRLVPGTNANNLVFQVKARFDVHHCARREVPMALWLLFEYVGVATITPGNCMITMNPLGNGSVMNTAPAVTASTIEDSTPSTVEGSGWLDKIKSALGVVNKVAKETGLASKLLNYVPTVGPALSGIAKQFGYGSINGGGRKRGRMTDEDEILEGGAVMGLGDFT